MINEVKGQNSDNIKEKSGQGGKICIKYGV
jgi:hypothetical protein